MSKITITNVPHEFEKGTIADSIQVNENFNNIVEQLSAVNDSIDNIYSDVIDDVTTKFDTVLGATYEDDALKETSLNRETSSIIAWINAKTKDIVAIQDHIEEKSNELGSKIDVITNGELENNDIYIARTTVSGSNRAEGCNCLVRKSSTGTVSISETNGYFNDGTYHYIIKKTYQGVKATDDSDEEETSTQKLILKEIYGKIPAGLTSYNGKTSLNFVINLPVEFYQDDNNSDDINSLYEATIYAHQKMATEFSTEDGTATFTQHNTVNGTVKYAIDNNEIDCKCIKGSITLAKGYNFFDLYFSVKGSVLDV